jgi:hypothetical protein
MDTKLISKALELNKQISALKSEETKVREQIKADLSKVWADRVRGSTFIESISFDKAKMDMTVKGEITEEELKLVGNYQAALFEKERIVEVLNPGELLNEIEKAGLNPWDFLELVARPSFMFKESKSCFIVEKNIPREDFLTNLNKVYKVLSTKAQTLVKEFVLENTEGKLRLTNKESMSIAVESKKAA